MPPRKTLQELLLDRLRAIPEGAVAQTARAAGMPVRHIVRLRQGKSLDIRLSTLERIAAGVGITPAELLTDPALGGLTAAEIRAIAAPRPQAPKPRPRIPRTKVRALQKRIDELFAEISNLDPDPEGDPE